MKQFLTWVGFDRPHDDASHISSLFQCCGVDHPARINGTLSDSFYTIWTHVKHGLIGKSAKG